MGIPNDGFVGFSFASPFCDGRLASGVCGALLLDDFEGGKRVAGFTLECDLRFGNGDPAPVGGLSISYMRTNDPVLLAYSAGDIALQMNGQVSPHGGQFSDYGNAQDLSLPEQGTVTGVSVGFQMHDSGDYHIPPDTGAVGRAAPGITHDGIGLHVRVDGTELTAVSMPNGTTALTYDQHGNLVPSSDPTGTNAGTDPAAIETGRYLGGGCDTNLFWVHFKMDLSTNGAISVWWKNVQVVTNLPTGLLPYPGRVLFAARVGSKPANIELDNLLINTTEAVPLPGPPSISIALQGGQPSSRTPAFCNLRRARPAGIKPCRGDKSIQVARRPGDVLPFRLVK